MTGRVTKKRDRWYIVLELGKNGEGQRVQKWEAGGVTKREAQALLTRRLNEHQTGTYIEPSRLTVADFLERWLRDYVEHSVRPTTRQGYRMIVRLHLAPAFRGLLLGELKPAHIQQYYARALRTGKKRGAGGLSPTTVLQHHRVLHEALRHAVRWKLLHANPANDVDPPRKADAPHQTLDAAQSRIMLQALADAPLVRLPVILATATGMRRGEVCALRWEDVDWVVQGLRVRQSVEVTMEGLALKPPKAGSGKLLPLPGYALRALQAHQAAQSPASPWVFPGEDHLPRHPDRLSWNFRRFIRRLDLPIIRFKDLRHTHATLLMAGNMHPKIVSERLGHSNIGITMDTYSHVTPSMGREAAELIESLLGAALDDGVVPPDEGELAYFDPDSED